MPRTNKEIVLVVVGAALLALFTLLLSPVLTKNIIFLVALPFAALIFMVLVLNIHATFIFLLWTRALMDPVLARTKIGGGSGMGGVLNLFLIVMVGCLVARFPKTLEKNRYLIPWVAFLAIGGVTVLYAPSRGAAIRFLLNLTTYLCMFITPFFIVKNEADKKFWIKTLLLSSFVPVAFANLGVVWHTDLLNFFGRLSGTFSHPNILAFYLVFVVTVAFLVLRTRILKLNAAARIILWLYIMDIGVLLIKTETRSAWVACALVFFIYGLLKERKVLFWGLMAMLLLAAVPQVQTRLKDLLSGTGGGPRHEQLNSAAWRMKLWESAMPSIKHRLLTGHGLESFPLLSVNFFSLEKKRGVAAHNVYVQLLFETGLLGFLAYLWIFWRLLKTFAERMRAGPRVVSTESTILLAYLLGYLFVGSSDNMLYYLTFNWYFWFFMGLMIQGGLLTPPQAPAVRENGAPLPS